PAVHGSHDFFPTCHLATSRGDISQSPQARQKEIRASPHRNKLRNVGEPLRGSTLARNRKISGHWTIANRRAIPQQRIALLCHPVKLGAHHPRMLHEFKRARQIRARARKVDPSCPPPSRRWFQRVSR